MEGLIKRLDLENDKHLYNQLYKIRSEYIKNTEGINKFTQLGGITKIIESLAAKVDNEASESGDKIIEVILSILGNCTCNSEESANQAFDAKIIEHVMTILDNANSPSIVSKACRLIGNLAQFQKIAIELQSRGIALMISNCLSEDADLSVLTMAIRAIRLLWNSKRFRHEILSFGSIYKIIVIFYKMLKNNNNANEQQPEVDSEVVILRRQHEPDRTISKEKLQSLIERMEKHEVEVSYEITKPERKSNVSFIMPSEKANLELVSGIIKCLLTITATSSAQVAKSVFADGFGISCLLFTSNETSKFRAMSLKIISNMSSNTFAQEYLGINNDLVSDVSSLLLNSDNLEKPLDHSEKRFCINILCMSSENACNRGKLRRSGVFKSLLSVANATECEKELVLLIFMFFQFRFDQLGLDTLLELGFIDVLIKILADLIKKKEVDHIKFDDPSLDEERKEEQKQKQKKRSIVDPPVGFNNFSKYMRYDPGSPSSSSSGYASVQQFSPSRCSGYSPFNSPARSLQDCDDSDSDIYSPVCSDNDNDDDDGRENTTKQSDFDILTYIYENAEIGAETKENDAEMLDIEDEASNMTLKGDENNESSKRPENETLKEIEADPINHILQLLWKVSIKNGDSPAFVRQSNLLVLLATAKIVKRPHGKIFQIFENILMQTRNFVAILKQSFVFKIYELSRPSYDHKDCYSCSKMKIISRELLNVYTSVAESGYGRGEITNFLLTGDNETKNKIAVSLTYIISCHDILNDFLFKYKALDIVMDISLSDNLLATAACDGLTIMANNLRIKIPSDDETLHKIIPDDFIVDETILTTKDDGDEIKFILKDGEISFDKETLKRSSEVFNSMLSGAFRESNSNEVKFPEYTVDGMKYFYQLIMLTNNKKLKSIAPKVNDISVVLQAYELSILYILTEIQKPLLNVIKIIINETSVQKVFEWSLLNVNQDLLITAICFYLCGNIDGKTKHKLFLEAMNSQYKNEWKQLIVDTILMKCQSL
ncbi:CLUMA_CG020017, isoform A [Clunio marinus]|uniref:CLUMA_CG020017, isoform A n=1 Tax=Clunio marinus TaxID=568069 RepID=A0A1J1J3M8_9DIPT|nr:CLUMA_CG020017, isoform A [Clunio marinus]